MTVALRPHVLQYVINEFPAICLHKRFLIYVFGKFMWHEYFIYAALFLVIYLFCKLLSLLRTPLNIVVERIMANQNQTSVSSAQFTELSADNAVYLESLYEQYLQDPQSVDAQLVPYFEQFASSDNKNALHHTIQEQFLLLARNTTATKVTQQSGAIGDVNPATIRELSENQMGVQKAHHRLSSPWSPSSKT